MTPEDRAAMQQFVDVTRALELAMEEWLVSDDELRQAANAFRAALPALRGVFEGRLVDPDMFQGPSPGLP